MQQSRFTRYCFHWLLLLFVLFGAEIRVGVAGGGRGRGGGGGERGRKGWKERTIVKAKQQTQIAKPNSQTK